MLTIFDSVLAREVKSDMTRATARHKQGERIQGEPYAQEQRAKDRAQTTSEAPDKQLSLFPRNEEKIDLLRTEDECVERLLLAS